MSRNALLKSSRLFHLYSGVFLAPALIFFAITGGLQTFSFHETTKGSNYKPPRILVELGQLHKKQTVVVPVRKGPPPDAKPDQTATTTRLPFDPTIHGDHTNQQKHDTLDRQSRPGRADRANDAPVAAAPDPPASDPAPTQPQAPTPPPGRVHNLLPMKIFFVIVSIGLFLSTLTGLFMAYKYTRNSLAVTATLVAGIVIPLLLLLF